MSEYAFRTNKPIECCEKCPLSKDDGRCGLGAYTYSHGISISCPLRELPPQDNPWRTGTPTEEGWYLFQFENRFDFWFKIQYLDLNAIERLAEKNLFNDAVWQKIKPYKKHKERRMANYEAKDITDAQKYAINGILEMNDELEFTGKTKHEAYLFIKEHIDDYESYKKQNREQNYRQEELEEWEIWEQFSTY